MNKEKYKESIDLLDLARFILKSRKKISLFTGMFFILGVTIALLSPVYYASEVKVIPQYSGAQSGLKGLGSLAAIAGINLGASENGGIPPTLYPTIFQSIPFQMQLLYSQIDLENRDSSVTVFDYYQQIHDPGVGSKIKKYTIGLPGLIKRSLVSKITKESYSDTIVRDSSGLTLISKEEFSVIKAIKKRVTISVNERDGYVTIVAEMPEALASAQLASRAMAILQKMVIEHKIEKTRIQLKFIEQRYLEKQKEFKRIQVDLAEYRDGNSNISTAIGQTGFETLQSEYNLTAVVFQELAQQLETQRIQVKKDTPLFTIIEPAVVPILRAKPRRTMIVMISLVIGLLISISFYTITFYVQPQSTESD